MSLQFVLGRAGSGKSYELYRSLTEQSVVEKDSQFVAVVPEQYSMEAQKEILNIHPNKGSFNIEVTSFNRLAFSVFEEVGISGYKIMDDLTKTMIVRKVLSDCKKDLVLYKGKENMQGFSDKIKTVISELKQYDIDLEKVDEMIEIAGDNATLKYKLKDIRTIYEKFEQYVNEKIITTQDALDILCDNIPNSNQIKNTHFYFDGFTGFTPIQLRVMELLIKYSKGVKVALTLPSEEKDSKSYDKYELFALSKETKLKLTDIALESSVDVLEDIWVGEHEKPYRISVNDELCHLEEHLFRENLKYEEETDNLQIHICKNPRKEAQFIANKIAQLVVEEGYRYKDLAVICADITTYSRYLKEEFDKHNIPAFIDKKRNIYNNPFVQTIITVLEIIEKDFSYEKVFNLIKLGTLDFDRYDISLMENYVLKSGRRGFKSYAAKWEKLYKTFTEEDLYLINEAREAILELVRPIRAEIKEAKTVKEYSTAAYKFLVEIKAQEKIHRLANIFKSQGNPDLAKEYDQAYETIVELFEKAVFFMGQEEISITEYIQIIKAGFETMKVGVIPPGLDTVMVGDLERTRLKDIKKQIFFAGVNDGIIPKTGTSNGVISDLEREFFENKKIVMAPTSRDNVFRQRFYLYSILAKPTEKIYFSYSKEDADSNTKRKSYLIGMIEQLFPKIETVDHDKNEYTKIIDVRMALDYIAENIGTYIDKRDNEFFENLYGLLNKDLDSGQATKLIAQGAVYTARKPVLSKELSQKLYGLKDNLSVTRLEKYATCAYMHFLRYGLRLNKREVYGIADYDIGDLYHESLEMFFKKVQAQNLEWENIDNNISRDIMGQCVDYVMEHTDNDAINSTARNLFIRNQVYNTSVEIAKVVMKHITEGEFRPYDHEALVEHGKVDRIDTFRDMNNIYVKVIDYKSGNKKYDEEKVLQGTQLQLMIYLNDAINEQKKKHPDCKVIPAGAYYFHVFNPIVDIDGIDKKIQTFIKKNPESQLTREEIMEKIIKEERYSQYKMSGLTVDDSNVIGWLDKNVAGRQGSSDIIPIKFTKDSNYYSGTKVKNELQYTKFLNDICALTEQMKEQIMSGDVRIEPVEDGCKYCVYRSICQHSE